jgi:anti-sigma factor RsiW
MLTCREVLDFLYGYVSSELPSAQIAAFEEHLAVCPPCVNYIDTYRTAMKLAKAAWPAEAMRATPIPDELVKAILAARAGNGKRSEA